MLLFNRLKIVDELLAPPIPPRGISRGKGRVAYGGRKDFLGNAQAAAKASIQA